MGACASAPPVAEPFDEAGDLLYVIVPHFNPARFRRRDALFRSSLSHLSTFPNVRVIAVEHHALNVASAVPKTLSPRVVSVLEFGSNEVFWSRENLINVGISEAHRLGASFIAWVDADVQFEDLHWAVKTLDLLQTHDFVQPWSTAAFAGPKGDALLTFTSFASNYTRMRHYRAVPVTDPDYWHPGLAWAAR
jgi:hypothetical protein